MLENFYEFAQWFLYALPFYDFDLRASHARTLLPAALASVPFGFVLGRVRVRSGFEICDLLSPPPRGGNGFSI